ncbi:tripartite tricarboxylate transporter TctB family protein [Nocardioides hwasunensis]|uniref:Tripartite tricarboxylate transporter TctB family protein n=1 Tax=Nocardioides hwasunensis TaxID=397258 RepID=A0ABR8MK16_9ACTN|nr:tripartite tricarboxylate transporter TctB family protein [Nocardioides hwasunensis]MBD3916374.1 tripartite tricarboxylate transporter TctB family protein [Nocardioides hwasunensis]
MTASTRARPSAELVTAGVVLVLGLAYGVQSLQEGIGTPTSSGAGFFPLLVAGVLVLSSVVVIVQERRGAAPIVETLLEEDDGGALEAAEVHWPRVVGVLLTSLAVPFLAGTVGFVTSLSVAMAVIAKLMGMRGWWRPAALGLAFGVITWWVFVYWLVVPLPAGVLGLG